MSDMSDIVSQKKRSQSTHKEQQAVERRRHQLRVAQQAFRRRKEDTIVNLQSEVSSLKHTVEELSHAFLAFSDILLQNDVGKHPHVAQALQGLTRQFVSAAQSTYDDTDARSGASLASITPGLKSMDSVVKAVVQPQQGESTSDEDPSTSSSIGNSSTSELIHHTTDSLELFSSAVPDFTNAEESYLQLDGSQLLLLDQAIPFDTSVPPGSDYSIIPSAWDHQHTNINIAPSPSSDQGLSSLTDPVYQHEFSQRLVQTCCRNGYTLLTDSPPDSFKIKEVFGSYFTPKQRANAICLLKDILCDTTGIKIGLGAHALVQFQGDTPYQSEWLDAYGVLMLLDERGVIVPGQGTTTTSIPREKPVTRRWRKPRKSGLGPERVSGKFDIATFIQRLSMWCVCAGPGPIFKRDVVTNLLASF